MAQPVSVEELQLKKRARRRLVGAVVLVAVVAVVLPMVLDSDPKPTSQEVNIQIPAPDSKGFISKVVPLTTPDGKAKAADKSTAPEKALEKSDKAAEKMPEKAVEKASEKAAEKPVVTAPDKVPAKAPEKAAEKSAEKAPAKVAEKPVEKSVEKPLEKAPAKAAERAPEKAVTLKPGMFYIQVTALADPDRVKTVQQRIAAIGVPAYTQTIPAGKGEVTRVRAGPFATRAEADKAQTALQGIGFDAKVTEVKAQ